MTISPFFNPKRIGLAALGSLLYFGVPWPALGIVSELLGPPLFFAWTVLVPGRTLAAWLGGNRGDALETVAAWVLCGLAVVMATAFLWALAGWDVLTYAAIAGAIPAVAVLAAPGSDGTRVPERSGATHRERVARLALLGLIVLLATAVLAGGPPLEFNRDTLDYIAYADEVSATGEAFPRTEFYRDPGADGDDLRKGLLHSWFGAARAWLGTQTVYLFAWLAALLLAAAALIVYGATRQLCGDGFAASVAAILFLLGYDGGASSDLIRSWFYPSRFGLVVLLALAASVMQLYRRPTAKGTVACVLLAFTAAAVHIQYAVLAPFVILIVLLWKTCVPQTTWAGHIKALATPALAVAAGILPYGVYRYLTAYQASDLHTQVQGAVFIFGGWFVIDPVLAWGDSGWLLLAALLSMIPLWSMRRRNAGVGFTIAATLTVLFVQYNPLVLTPLYGVITYLVHRLDQTMPYFLLPAFLVSALAAGRIPRRIGTSGALALLCIAVAVISGVVSLPQGLGVTPAARARIAIHTPVRWQTGLGQLATRIPPGSVIASDPVTSYAVTAFTPHYVLSTLDQHAPPNDRLAPVRMTAARDILSPFTSVADRVELMRFFGVSHVVVNENVPAGLILDYFTMDPAVAALSKREFDRWPGVFQKLALGDGLTLYKLAGPTPPRVPPPANPFFAPRVPRDAFVVDAPAGEARLVAAGLHSERLERGEPLRMELFWTPSGPRRARKYVVSVRLDQMELSLPFDGRPFPKLARKFREWLEGQRFRARADYMIAWGFYGPDAWPEGGLVADLSSMTIPPDLAPGRYTVRVKLLASAHARNHQLRDFFFDDDVYHGVPVGEITVE